MIVGVAGKACAGKDLVTQFFSERGFLAIDADRLGHRALEANQAAVLARFGTLDRRILGTIVFSDPAALADLEAISHPWIAGEVNRQILEATGPVVLNAALLHKLDLVRRCDVVVWVSAPLLTRILRARSRDGWSWRRILTRIWAQRQLSPHVFPKDVDILKVENDGTPERVRLVLEDRFRSVLDHPK